jgi:hypothetical protein
MAYNLLELSDIAEIRQLNARYNRLADQGESEAYANCYTEDAEFEIVGNRTYCGRVEIAAAVAATQVTVHVTTEPEIELNGDTARQRVRMLSIVRAPDASRNEFVASGWYIDTLKRTSGGWLFQTRRVQLDLSIQEVFQKMGVSDAFNKLASD